MQKFIQTLNELKIKYTENEPMSVHTSFRAGGSARLFIEPESIEQLISLIEAAKTCSVNYLVIGYGSNLLVKDEGYNGAIICLSKLNSITLKDENTVTAYAGARLSSLCLFAHANGLVGLEFAGGIPGSVGGGLFMNAGAYGGELKDVVKQAQVFDGHNIVTLSNEELELGYRTSVFHKNSELIVLSVDFALEKGDVAEAKKYLAELNKRRRDKQPLEYPSAGSTFKRPTGYYAGALIEGSDLKGYCVGNAEVSVKHAGFVVNKGGASATDILSVINHVKQTVYEKDGVMLETEVMIIGG